MPRRRNILSLFALSSLAVVTYFFLLDDSPSVLPHTFTHNRTNVPEIYGLMYMATRTSQTLPADSTPGNMSVYDGGEKQPNWLSRLRGGGRGRWTNIWEDRRRVMDAESPVVVFSKTYCPYSRRAKELLTSYSLSPAVKVVEVDLRSDAAEVKSALARLTGRGTFPNVLVGGQSIGGADDVLALHKEQQLRGILEKAGVVVGASGVWAVKLNYM